MSVKPILILAMTVKISEVERKLKGLKDKGKTAQREYLDKLLAHPEIQKDEELKKKIEKLRTPSIIKGDPAAEYELTYDTFMETLEPMYYWLLDFLRESLGYSVDKVADYFAASEASGFYGEMGMRKTQLEKRAMELLAIINGVIKSIINLVYDMREFELRFKHYDDLKSKDTGISKTGDLSLKTIWLTEVDMKKGAAAINMLVQNLNFVLLRDAFVALTVPSGKDLEKIKTEMTKKIKEMDITDITKRILEPRIAEYIDWRAFSEKELRKRYDVEKAYLKSQVDALKLYTRWARPYMIATQRLIPAEFQDMSESVKEAEKLAGPELITPFDVMHIYIELLGKKEIKTVTKQELKVTNEDDKVFLVIELRYAFRAAGGAIAQGHYSPRGKVVIKFLSYALTTKQLADIEKKKEDEVLGFIDDITKETLNAMSEDLKKYIEGKEDKKEEKKPEVEIPFITPLLKFGRSAKEYKEKAKSVFKMPTGPKKEAWLIALLLVAGKEKVKGDLWKLYELYKKAYRMTTW